MTTAVTGSELYTSEIAEIADFVAKHATDLENAQISIRRKDGRFLAELFGTNEPAT